MSDPAGVHAPAGFCDIEQHTWQAAQTHHKYKFNFDGSISTRNRCAASLPENAVKITSGRTTYCFTGHYDGQRSLSSSGLRICPTEKIHGRNDNPAYV